MRYAVVTSSKENEVAEIVETSPSDFSPWTYSKKADAQAEADAINAHAKNAKNTNIPGEE